ncbi:MAG: 16S rRNA (cytosine(1402)-N(4))-methyltransferase RsmH [Holosporales bacterium]|jgi:16S rRNA (cytosine1402-N4)-methyltransferase|nr:16S rRNA (cytosine(1402)-N(4))-methyltransferase RsmH [Holosporales bacterium]
MHIEHVPVLLNEVLEYLDPKDGHAYVDATFGGGGYSRAILERAAGSRVVAIDRDPAAAERAKDFVHRYGPRFAFYLTNFGNISEILESCDYSGIVFDFGVSSFQLEDGARGFSFQNDGPLDMRMGAVGETIAPSANAHPANITAADVVNSYSVQDLTRIIKTYGDEPHAKKISDAIVRRRRDHPILTTLELANIVRSVVRHSGAIDPATKTFQALRIFVNDELREIQCALDSIASDVVARQLRQISVITVSFHSLEDRIVKNWWTSHNRSHACDRGNTSPRAFSITQLHSRVITPSTDELRANPRCRSARMRAFSFC